MKIKKAFQKRVKTTVHAVLKKHCNLGHLRRKKTSKRLAHLKHTTALSTAQLKKIRGLFS